LVIKFTYYQELTFT